MGRQLSDGGLQAMRCLLLSQTTIRVYKGLPTGCVAFANNLKIEAAPLCKD
jgi:hypothetical protein